LTNPGRALLRRIFLIHIVLYLQFMNSLEREKRLEALYCRFNEPVVTRDHLERWLEQFPDDDRRAALVLLEKIEFHSFPRLIRECRQLHGHLQERLTEDGFDGLTFKDVDFSREFTAKSGDIISYLYRKATAVPSVDFKNFDLLISRQADCPEGFCDRALVILDDYIGTGSQFIFQFLARSEDDIRVLNSYRKVYLASIVTHDNAFLKLSLLQKGEYERVLSIEEAQFPDYDWAWEEKDLQEALRSVDWSKLTVICVEREHPLLSPENACIQAREREMIRQFLSRHGGDSTLTTSYLAGHHAFFYGAPNSLPKILLPLLSRVEDLSIYPTEHFIGVSADIVSWSMDDLNR
jgi:hypothetical protein